MAGGRITMLMQDVINEVKEISEISGYVSVVRKPFFSLAGRLTIMIPFFQEIRDVTEHASRNLYEALSSLLDHLETTRKLLQQGSKGSKIYLVLERKEIMRKYNAVVAELEKDLKRIYFEKLDHISHEVKEQAVLVLGQFDRARGKQFDAPTDNDLYEDLYFMYDKGINGVLDPEVLNGVIQALELNKPTALEQESVALSKIIVARGGDADGSIEKMFMVLKLIKDFLHKDDGSVDSSQGESLHICARQGIADIINYDNKVIPNEFLCPITLQVMEDPVFVSTGQTYERLAIQTWIQAGNGTCPKTGQFLTNTTLTPNYALRYLIVQWRETNRIDEPKGASTIAYSCTPAERKLIRICIRELETERYYYQRTGAGEIYQLTTRNAQIREAIGEAGVIPLLSKALQANDEGTQEYAMKALLNLSICPRNRKRILEAGAIPEIIDVMNSGSLKVCEDGATILLGLSMTDEIRFLIGSHEGLQAFVYLLSEGTERGQKEAATIY
ncbi:hypothetical protein L6452_42730 [Arctium lappa]|uniref:Uncharacterized protein n=1 Tax=Arctium lappa TaxID=4217 RepID=A0ACB8XJ17_ARCLA|nr:hypothetical protein L6452_42730 [Arctium lappa]